MLDRLCGALRLLPAHSEFGAAARDGHVEGRLDLAQVLVKGPAQAREALIVDRVKPDFDGFAPQASSPLREWGRAAAMRTCTYV
jgi:hypothetical protein